MTLDAGCRVRATARLDPSSGPVAAVTIDARDRPWILGHEHPTVDSRNPLLLTIAG